MAEPAEKMHSRARPLSPHLQVYRWPITMAASITHRATGIALSLGTVIVVWWLIAIASGPQAYGIFSMVVRSPLGLLVLFGFVWSLAYHLFSGIRHLVWDAGYGFDVRTADRTAFLVYALSILAAVGVFAYAFAGRGVLS